MSTKRNGLWALSALAVFVVVAPVFGDADDQIRSTTTKVHDILENAINGTDGTPPTSAQRTASLMQARELMKHLPAGRYRNHKKAAISDIDIALTDINQKAADATIVSDLRDIDSEIRDIQD